MTDLKRSMRSDNPLNGKHIVFLGSSVTYGAASNGVSFVDFLAEKMGCRVTKEAVSGTTLVDDAPDSYICRMKKLNPEMKVDLFVCQLSTNDATQMKDLGEACRTYDMDDFNTLTVAGAIEYIIAYARKTWKCPVAFYTSPRYDSARYAAMVGLLQTIRRKWDIALIDLWNDSVFNDITAGQRSRYMADPIHPTREGYLEWWTPYFKRVIVPAIS
ncbi:MAG: SGNH/GDSL hydrolase family protein [Lachnospiraceae bacterium]|nr:SGNH/GDSL hydrolase family protein [Lachnospiraceae bacterium]